MSLINSVLKDVEQRKQAVEKGNGRERITAGLSAPENKEINRKKQALLLLIVFVFLGFAAIVYHHFSYSGKTKKPSSIEVLKSKVAVKQPVKSLPVSAQAETAVAVLEEPAVTLLKTVFKIDKKIGALTFELSNSTHYTIHHSNNNQQLIVTLSNTKASGDLSKSIDNGWLQSSAYQEVNGDLVITINMQPNVVLQRAVLITSPQLGLLLGFYNPTVSAEAGAIKKVMLPLTLEQKAQQEYQEALSLLNEQQEQFAIIKLRKILKIMPAYIPARETLATLLYKSGDKVIADKLARVGLMQDATNHLFITLRAHILADKGQIASAIRLLEGNSQSIMANQDSYAFLAVLYQRNGNYVLAAKTYSQLTTVQPNNAMWWVGLGVSLESAGSKNAAIEAYAQALKYGVSLNPSVRAYIESKVNGIAQ